MKTLTTLIVTLIIMTPLLRAEDYLNETPEEKAARMGWFKEARFGMFIHWGVYATYAGHYRGTPVGGNSEWILHRASIPLEEYEQAAQMFNPVFFNADDWVQAAKDAGMKYIVITSKHHDGFALWDSKVSDWDIMDASPFQRDILKELAEACERHDIRLCFYHSIMDWHHPDAQAPKFPFYNRTREVEKQWENPNFPRYIENYMKPQLKELLTDYGDIGILWFDGEWIPEYTTEMGKDVYNYVRSLQPDIIINNRVDKGRQGMAGLTAKGDFAGDYGTPEQEIPDTGLEGVDWESCMTMNRSWGWKAGDNEWKSTTQLIHNLIDSVSKGGNYLLNVGPTGGGYIPRPSLQRLAEIGDWMDQHSEAIHGAKASPFRKPGWGSYTMKEDAVYAIIHDWPSARAVLNIPYLEGERYRRVEWLHNGESIGFERGNNGLVIPLPDAIPNPHASVIKLSY